MRIVFVGDIKQRGNKDEAANSKINNATGKMEHAGVEEVLHSVAPPKNGQKKTTVRVHRGSVDDFKIAGRVKVIFPGIVYNAIPAAFDRKNFIDFAVS